MDRILVVEDSVFYAQILQKSILKNIEQCQITLTHSFAETEAALEKHGNNFLIAILDLNLPDAPQGEIVDLITDFKIPAFVLTGQFSDDLQEFIWSKRVVDYIIKEGPLSIDYVINFLKRFKRNCETKVLVVDDSMFARKHMRNLLLLHRFQILEAENGEQALQVLEQYPDVKMIITDCNMPVMDGFRLTLEVRRKYGPESLAIIGMSSSESIKLSARFIKNGANDFINKPFLSEQFYCRVNQNIDIIYQVDQVKDARKQAEAATQARTDILYFTSHEFKTPLNAILGLTEMLLEKKAPYEEVYEMLDHIHSASKVMLELANQFLDLAQLETGSMTVVTDRQNLHGILKKAVQLVAGLARKRQVTLELPEPTEFYVMADNTRLRQIFLNILSNGIKYNRSQGRVNIQILQTGAEKVRVAFKDTGFGIAQEHHHKIFQPFQRVDKDKRSVEGTGIGLALSKRLAILMGGDLDFESEANQGSTFWVELKLDNPGTRPSSSNPTGITG